jgi:hypothetical protein
MNEFDDFDRVLQESLSADAAPMADTDFERRLQARLAARKLRPIGRGPILAYAGMGLTTSVLAMALAGMDWRIGALSIVLPSVAVVPLFRPFLKR